jgi:hypothetical protein
MLACMNRRSVFLSTMCLMLRFWVKDNKNMKYHSSFSILLQLHAQSNSCCFSSKWYGNLFSFYLNFMKFKNLKLTFNALSKTTMALHVEFHSLACQLNCVLS